jgi:hypothetical protein
MNLIPNANDLAKAGAKIVQTAEDNATQDLTQQIVPAIKAAIEGVLASETGALKSLIAGKKLVVTNVMTFSLEDK